MFRPIFAIALWCLALPLSAQWNPERDFRFRNGDRVEIAVYQGEKAGTVIMRQNITLDGVGHALLANGKKAKIGFGNMKSALAAIEEGYRTEENLSGLDIEAQILAHNGSPVFTVLGEVDVPGHGKWQEGISLADAVARAGGFKKGAYKKRVMVQRAGVITVVDCREAEKAAQFKIAAGDVVMVELAPFRF